MFDPSFFELIIICIVALLVLGPDRLPGAIKTLGLWIGRLRRSFNNIKREIEQEVGADEIRRQLRNEAIMEKFNNTKSQISNSIESVKSEAESIKNELDITRGLSGNSNDPDTDTTDSAAGAAKDSADPIDKLPTNDPAAKTGNGAATTKSTESQSPSTKASPESGSTESSIAAGTAQKPSPDVTTNEAVKPDNSEK